MSGFTDVDEAHPNAGDIDCIAYYGITKGTSATTFSPSMSVTREHMALFLARLARLVGMDVASDPSDPGFVDDDGLSAESRTAIAQLADLGVTRGTSATTFSPAANVKRGNMALFVQRLMNKMTVFGDGPTARGNLPSDVAKNTDNKTIGSPFTDLGTVTKDQFDAVTQLWELGVASGVSDTLYGPASDITRAAMAGFMAALLDHSNARPAGLSIQATKTEEFGAITDSDVVVSYRSDDFGPVADQAVDIFYAAGLQADGTCNTTTGADNEASAVGGGTVCERDANDPVTGDNGNLFFTGDVREGHTRIYYAWTGKEGAKFQADTVDEVSVSITAKYGVAGLEVTSTVNEEADTSVYDSDADPPGNDENTALEANGQRVDLDVVRSVSFTIQLTNPSSKTKNVAKADEEVSVKLSMAGATNSVNVYPLKKTDREGKTIYQITAPDSTSGDDRRLDTLEFSHGGTLYNTVKILWLEDDPVLTRAEAKAFRQGDDRLNYFFVSGTGAGMTASIPVRVDLYDQYGNRHKAPGQYANIGMTATLNATAIPTVSRNARSGTARYTLKLQASSAAGLTLLTTSLYQVALDNDTDLTNTSTITITPEVDNFFLLKKAKDGDTTATAGVAVGNMFHKNEFWLTAGAASGTLYSYDSDDVFAYQGRRVTLDRFEFLMGADASRDYTSATVAVIKYDTDGSSIFHVVQQAIEN